MIVHLKKLRFFNYRKKVYGEKYIQAIPVNSLKSGIYILKAISNDGKIITRKLIKE